MSESARSTTRQAWCERLDRFAMVNQTVAQFCKTEGVSVAAFYRWRQRLKQNAIQPNSTLPGPAKFVPVKLPQEPQAPTPQTVTTVLSVELPGGVRVRLEVHGDQEQAP